MLAFALSGLRRIGQSIVLLCHQLPMRGAWSVSPAGADSAWSAAMAAAAGITVSVARRQVLRLGLPVPWPRLACGG